MNVGLFFLYQCNCSWSVLHSLYIGSASITNHNSVTKCVTDPPNFLLNYCFNTWCAVLVSKKTLRFFTPFPPHTLVFVANYVVIAIAVKAIKS